MDGMLSQEEINALLSGMDVGGDAAAEEPAEAPVEETANELTEMQRDTLGEISNISMGTAATTLSSLLNQKVNISTPVVTYAKWDDLVSSYDRPCVFMTLAYKEGLNGKNVLVLKQNDVKIITDLMMGGDGSNVDGEITDLHLSAIGEAMNQMMGSAATSISSMLDMKIDILPPTASLIDLNDGEAAPADANLDEFVNDIFVKISFSMVIGDLVDSQIMQLYPIDFAKHLCEKFEVSLEKGADAPIEEPAAADVQASVTPDAAPAPAPAPQAAPQGMPMQQMPPQGMPMQQMPPQGMPMQQMPQGMPMYYAPQPDVNVQPAQFTQFAPNPITMEQRENIGLIMDVPLEVTAELGRTSKSIQEILDFAPGTIIELDKMAGEPIDVLVNGKFVAKGEVVVIEESFGIRVTEIIQNQ